MDAFLSVIKEEYPSGGSSGNGKQPMVVQLVPQPIEGLHDSGPPPFLTKVYDMVDHPDLDRILSWSRGGQSFVVWDPQAFSTNLLPRYFKHNNFSSFIRQLNTYGFRKIDPDIWEFANEAFLRGQRHILKNIKRRKAPSHTPPQQQPNNPCVEVGRFGLNGEVERLQRDKQVLMMELVKLRQQQQNTRAHLQEMEHRLLGTEKKQQKMMSFLAKALQNPDFLQKLSRHGKKNELEEAMIKKRRRPIDQGPSCVISGESSKKGEEFGDVSDLQVSELEELALEMQGIGRAKRTQVEEQKEIDEGKDFEEEFWEELFSERFDMTASEGGQAN
ncbi:heat stress transcription factor A-2b [Lactuca sativa]|uniref:Heat stress transcription factor n=1 Tax=Lactuca sativa TaxID=4236 RepID=A0A9R1UDS5_LACSA|nr:heat stress transcription factor A-2b [Lactuca sativa]KAJ0185362.1 hypothetical protein LSAT_V11C900458310 [Lactuca sativa]